MVRRRVEIKKIEDRSKRQVCFSKRRKGLFKKADDFCKKFDANVAIMAVSAAGNFYAFGSPSFDSVLQRYKAVKSQQESEVTNAADEDEDDGNNAEEEEDDDSGDNADEEEDSGVELGLAAVAEGATEQGRTVNECSERALVLYDDDQKVGNMAALWDIPVKEDDDDNADEEGLGLDLALAYADQRKIPDQENKNSEKGLILIDDPNHKKMEIMALREDKDNVVGLELGLASVVEGAAAEENKNPKKGLVSKDERDQNKVFWDIPVDDLKMDELEDVLARMEEIKKRVVNKIQQHGSEVKRG